MKYLAIRILKEWFCGPACYSVDAISELTDCYRLVFTKDLFNSLPSASQTKPKLLSYMPWGTGSIVSVAVPVLAPPRHYRDWYLHQHHNIYKEINKNTELYVLEPAIKTRLRLLSFKVLVKRLVSRGKQFGYVRDIGSRWSRYCRNCRYQFFLISSTWMTRA